MQDVGSLRIKLFHVPKQSQHSKDMTLYILQQLQKLHHMHHRQLPMKLPGDRRMSK